jgi:gluconate 5-dehydrogenase
MPALTLFDLTGRTALVTGAGQGIGLALAAALAGAGARVILNGRTPAKLETAAADLRATGADVGIAAFDVTDADAVRTAVDGLEARGTALDILVNNAGLQRRARLDRFDAADWRALVATNLDAVFHVGQAVARHMIARGRGKIINVASVQSELARASTAPYAATKGAVKMLTRGMCADWGPLGLQVNALAPGFIETELTRPLRDDPTFDGWLRARTPAGRWGQVNDLAGAAVFLASAASDFVNGHMLFVDGGVTAVV